MDIAKTLRDRRENPMKNGCNPLGPKSTAGLQSNRFRRISGVFAS